MKVQVVSDLHLEFADLDIDNTHDADVLILSGDIMVVNDLKNYTDLSVIVGSSQLRGERYFDFIEYVCKQYRDVIMVMGNHEHYNGYINSSETIIKKTFDHLPNFTLLEKESVVIDDVNFIGGTLWTDFGDGDWETMEYIVHMLNDYSVIRMAENGTRLTTQYVLEDHKRCLKFIDENVKEGKTNVVIGHHAPSHKSTHVKYMGYPKMNRAYVSDLDDFILKHPDIKLWTHGHTHTNFDYMIGDTRVYCNPKGYYDENPDFTLNEVIEV